MKKEIIEGYTTKEGEQLIKYTLELGDEFIPQIPKCIEKESTKKDGSKLVNYSIPAEVKGFKDIIFISLTPTQAKIINETEKPTEKKFHTYSYKNKLGEWIGISANNFVVKKLSDFE